MIRKIFKKRKVDNANFFVEPDEIFLDSANLANFDRQQFEGRIEKPISKQTVLFLGFSFILFIVVFGARLGYLQIKNGGVYLQKSENNTLAKVTIFADRGIIYDRNKVELAWNQKNEDLMVNPSFSTRMYLSPGFSHMLGYISYPAQDDQGNFWQSEFIGKDGLEKEYNTEINGTNGSKIVEMDAHKNAHSENIVDAPVRGTDLTTTVDSRIQSEAFSLIKNAAENFSFSGGAGVIMNIQNGEIITSTSYPEYNSEILSL